MQHYIFSESKFRWVNCGHCMGPERRHRKPDAKACQHYIYNPSAETRFVSKEYLTKELLKYVLSLDLPPQIEPCDENE